MPYVRLVGCQGSVQLATALAALETHSQSMRPKTDARNFLLVHHLSTPAGQDADFANCIGELASRSVKWDGIHYLDPPGSKRLLNIWRRQGRDAACAALRELIGVEHVDELHLGQNINFEHRLLADAFPQAKRIACGDGIGVNFTRGYFALNAGSTNAAAARTWRLWWRELRTRLKLRKPAIAEQDPMAAVKPDYRYLLLPNLFDEIETNYRLIPREMLAKVFAQFAEHPQLEKSRDVADAAAAIRAAQRAVVILPSNFSETKRMELEAEIQCYSELVREAAPPQNTAVIIKPHPRDSHEKILALRQSLEKSYASVTVLGDEITFYAPFESIVTYYLRTIPNFLEKTTTICVSSSCLGLAYLYGARTIMGIGEARVNQHFAPQWRELRLRHERDLIAALEHVHRLRASNVAA